MINWPLADIADYDTKSANRSNLGLAGGDFLHLKEGLCKFPLGLINETPERFCGEVTLIGASYCSQCQIKAYTRTPRRR